MILSRIVYVCIIAHSFSILAMQEPTRKVKEMFALDVMQHPHQVRSFTEAYIAGTVKLDGNGALTFNDYEKADTAYMVSHVQAVQVLDFLRARRDEIIERNEKETKGWLKNPFVDLSANQINVLQGFRLISFEFDLDLNWAQTLEPGERNNQTDLTMVRLMRTRYKESFRTANSQLLNTIAKASLHVNNFCSLPEHLKRVYEVARKAYVKHHMSK